MASTWRIGELGQRTGLTVRTLHHWDHVGLLRPSARTSAGHRLYDERDVDRLYRIVALRELGLPLETIGVLLDGGGGGGLELAGLLDDHLAHVERQLAALGSLRDRLAMLVPAVRAAGGATPVDLLAVIEEVTRVEDTIRNYFTEEQLAALAQRREQLGEAAIRSVEEEWPRLIAQVQAELDAGTDPAEPRVRALATRWMELLEAFHGGDPGLRDSLYRMYAEQRAEITQEHGGPSPELIDYVKRSVAAG
ncbi:MerR family transcriptional regulator [Micromonospora sp. DR5-3]|uniref:MerR family transcriptional regulator n=1 Tax=unclassified Micromonospora TaxID=2617518 RepID=UPI0011D8498D|nr:MULTISPECIES: MerR family transcriptional regulator [unclassified Micromonospora]MCW3814579.1 MerR family transcriptional regulator [Micromonospora sp. DR5-3]TYC23272.1 MerR family transcriptional regulator [Micromonospora sp. MP36]